MIGSSACVTATVFRTLAFRASDHNSGWTVSIGPEGKIRSGTRTTPRRFRLCGLAPWKATCGRVSIVLKCSMASWVPIVSATSRCSGLTSALDSLKTCCSSSMLEHTIYTTNPRRSRSSDSDRVMGEFGGPAITTTSRLAPLLARRALLLRLYDLLCLHSM